MTIKPRRILTLLALFALLPACAAAPRILPLDASGMEHPAGVASATLRDQVDRTSDRITGFPAAVADHCRTSVRNLSEDPSLDAVMEPR